MEEENHPKSFNSSTNWLARDGSLDDSISFETPITPIDDDQSDLSRESKALTPKSVLLEPPPSSSDSTPCHITLSFEKKHEIRQVYVRSTARIFEIYYTTEPRSGDDYLCTVRCGLAAKDDAALSTGPEEAPSAPLEGSIDQKNPTEEKIKTDSSSNSDEDGWVEIKAPGSALLDNRICSLAKSVNTNTEKSNSQDFYEATAEITDSTPCISLTIRLLSLQTKGCVHIEEIYVFGEPVESTDSVDKVNPMNTSTGSAMMAMLVPSLLQLSRKGSLNKKEDEHRSDIRQVSNPESDNQVDSQFRWIPRGEAISSLPNQEKADVQAATKDKPESTPRKPDKPEPDTSQAPAYANHVSDSFSDRMERTLDQLVHRVVRLESFCLRFEENMLKPISNIETRLERMEQQLEVLTTRSHSTVPFPCTRITAPDFSDVSSTESETNSLQNNEDKRNSFGSSDASTKSEFAKPLDTSGHKSGSNSLCGDRNDQFPEISSNNGVPDSVVNPPKVPGMIITAPEFLFEEDNDDSHFNGVELNACDDNFSSVEMSSTVNKRALSVDDALAMAFAEFVSTSAQPPRKSGPWIFKGPNSQDENICDSSNDSSVSRAKHLCRLDADSDGHNETQNLINLESTSSNSSQGNEVKAVAPPNIGSTEAVNPLQDEETDTSGGGDDSVTQPSIRRIGCIEVEVNNMENTNDGFAALKTPQTNAVHTVNLLGDSSTEAVIKGCIFGDEGSSSTDGSCYHQSSNGITSQNDQMTEVNDYRMKDFADEFAALKLHTSGEDVTANPENIKDEVETILDGNYNSRVDFEHPVLDVKFSSYGNLNSGSSLETLLGDASDANLDGAHDNNGSETCMGRDQETLEVDVVDSLLVEIDQVDCVAVSALTI